MAKYKAARGKKADAPSNARAIPCLILVLGAIVALAFLFYYSLKSQVNS
ncbi:MAG: hypothetical protein SFV18_13710 [Bryobacteraceae bacterium]|nr:hypothetical protein [Bryobacteraceae bacterium]